MDPAIQPSAPFSAARGGTQKTGKTSPLQNCQAPGMEDRGEMISRIEQLPVPQRQSDWTVDARRALCLANARNGNIGPALAVPLDEYDPWRPRIISSIKRD